MDSLRIGTLSLCLVSIFILYPLSITYDFRSMFSSLGKGWDPGFGECIPILLKKQEK